MEPKILALQNELDDRLRAISSQPDPMAQLDQSLHAVQQTIAALKSVILQEGFATQREEIDYFKLIAPAIYSRHIFFTKAYNLQCKLRTAGRERRRRLIDKELRDLDRYAADNADFYHLYYKFSGPIDEQIFTRKAGNSWIRDELASFIDSDIPLASYKMAVFMAHKDYATYLEDQLRSPNEREVLPSTAKPHKIEFKRSKSALIELCVGIFLSEAFYFNDEPITLSQLIQLAACVLHIDLKDFKNLDYANRLRKKDLTPFLSDMIQRYEDRAQRLNT